MPAYNNYFPASYQPMQYQPQYQVPVQTQQVQQAPQSQSTGVNWVQGEAGARSWLVAPNTTVLLMDSEAEKFYLKSTDASGMPLPLRTFKYSELTAGASQQTFQPKGENNIEYALKSDLEALRAKLDGIAERFSKEDAKNGE